MLKEKILSSFSANKFIIFGAAGIFLSILIFILTFFPVIKAEYNYEVFKANSKNTVNSEIVPVDTDFGIVIPKINANSKVIPNVDPYNASVYQWALTKGIAHAKGTSLPGEPGNSFMFSHSAVNFYQAAQYNAVFYLLSKLEKGDEIFIYYKNQKYVYRVSAKAIVDPSSLFYLTQKTGKRLLTLMTCWPPGTTLQRLVIVAEII